VNEILAPATGSVHSLAGLKGKTIAVNILNSEGADLIYSSLKAHGITAAQVRLVAMPFPAMLELVGSSNGIGYQMNNASGDFDLTGLWAGIVLLGILGYVLNAAVLGIEHHMLAWHRDAHRLTS
jgi:ABC-type nitrate/sulfonate/bicarbonate transport system permease component